MAQARIVFRLTRDEQLAVLSVLAEHWGCPEGCVTEEFTNTQGPPIKYHDLIMKFARTPEVEEMDDEAAAQGGGEQGGGEQGQPISIEQAQEFLRSVAAQGRKGNQ